MNTFTNAELYICLDVLYGPKAKVFNGFSCEQLAETLNAKQISNTHAGHYIQKEQPQLVIEAIQSIFQRK